MRTIDDVAAGRAGSRGLTVGRAGYPVLLPNLRDPRLHVAAVIVTIHVLGQVKLHFQVTVPQILSAILTCAVIEVALTFRARRAFVWPASAMLTGSGVALILRVPTTPVGDHWSFHAWYVFAGVAAFSLATKYVIRYRGSHVFNPSNIGLVIAFIVLGSTRIEPLDFWWAPLGNGMILAYAVILGGGLLITARLGLLAAAVTFWVTLAAGIGVLAASGHCMVARWAFAPVCGVDYWRVIITSPEVLIFLFFMITDPKTVPSSRRGRIAFGFLVAVVSTLLMAPQTNEFGTKVALLGGLAVVCACRPVFDRLAIARRRSARTDAAPDPGPGRPVGALLPLPLRVGVALVMVAGLGAAIVAAGSPARGDIPSNPEDVFGRVPHQVDPATFPTITVEQDVLDWNHEITGAGAREIVLLLAENLELEREALLRADPTILQAVDHGERLREMQGRLQTAAADGTTVVDRYDIDDIDVSLLVPFGEQTGLSLGMRSRGTVTTETYDESGHLQHRESAPFATTFVMRRATGARWLNVAEKPYGAGT
jgi:Na+-translocating ferredoxin:NAD+ oxidoreductase RnfD subunit